MNLKNNKIMFLFRICNVSDVFVHPKNCMIDDTFINEILLLLRVI